MISLIKTIDPSLLEIQSVFEYLSQFEGYIIKSKDIEPNTGEISAFSKNDFVKIVFLTIIGGKWWSIYRYHSDGTKYEQVDVIMYDEIKKDGYNNVIKFSGHQEDDNCSYITCLGVSLLNNKIIKSWKQYRVVPVQDLPIIQYVKSMNLTELILMTDDKSSDILKKEEEHNLKKLVLKIDIH